MKNISFYMVFMEGERTPTYKHESLLSAETEARRLVKAHGGKAYILKAFKAIKPRDEFETVVLTDDEHDDLPF